jgi:hypothetical protein
MAFSLTLWVVGIAAIGLFVLSIMNLLTFSPVNLTF